MKPILYGYIRVSAKDQNEDRQFIALAARRNRYQTDFCR